MLLISCHNFFPNTRIRKWAQISKLFENLVAVSMKNYLGHAIKIGSPRNVGVPKGFTKCIGHVCSVLNESRGVSPRIHWKKDGGVDVIAWRPFDDRSGQVVLLVQCTSGKGWNKKICDISLRTWDRWIHFAAVPITALAFPFVFNTGSPRSRDQWLDFSCKGGILLDRLRLASFHPIQVPPSLKQDVIDWSERQISKLQPDE